MMDAYLLHKDSLPALLDGFLQDLEVLAPVRRDDLVLYEPIASGDEALLDFAHGRLSPKGVFSPRTEVMFTYHDGQAETPGLGKEKVLFGARPCDAASFSLLDRVFDVPGLPDAYYIARRRNTTVVGLACSHPRSTCFCTSVGGGPFNQQGLDVLLSDTGDHYLVEVLSEKGKRLMGGSALLEEATAQDIGAKERLEREAVARIGSHLAIEGLKEKLDGLYDDPFWDALHEKCLGCGACTYLCPTCHCFDIVDEGNGSRGRRLRIWDSCQYPLFTLHASGHNPRPSSKERMRQRVMHKFRYFVENSGQTACVGCGRCIRNCPVNMDIRQVLGAIMER